jgi:hypothetical protein
VETWFANYTKLCVGNAIVAQEEGVDVLCVGVELDSMQQYVTQWRDLVQAVREVFKGEVVFAVGATWVLADFAETNDRQSLGRNLAAFWDIFDYAEMTCWSPAIEAQRDQRLSALVGGFASYWQPAFSTYSASYPGLAVAFGEVGAWQHDGAGLGYDPSATVPDAQEFTDLWVAYLAGAQSLGASAIAVWEYELVGGRNGLGLVTLNGTAALRAMVSILGGSEPPAVSEAQGMLGSIPDWGAVPYTYSYPMGVTPSKLYLGSQLLPVSRGEHWGLPGSDVKGIKLYGNAAGFYIRWETYSGDIAQNYRYANHLRPVGGRGDLIYVEVTPRTGEVHLTVTCGESSINLDSQIRLVELGADSFTALICDLNVACVSSAQALAGWDVVAALLYGGQWEWYELPPVNVLR